MTHLSFISTIYETLNKLRKASTAAHDGRGRRARHADRCNYCCYRPRSMDFDGTTGLQPALCSIGYASDFFYFGSCGL